jgi:ubiquinol-cytochrome c reductase cytochrome b subunit
MRNPVRRIAEWVGDRTGVDETLRTFLDKKIPASAGWHQVFGSVALFVLLVQAVTGILLALNFAPTPQEAYPSLRFIMQQVVAGRFIRGLHHWGASLMIITAAIHMTQVFLWKAYKRPHDLTWFIGVLLLLVILGFGLTGYLLPWDNRAYWGTVVTTRILASVPLLGAWAARLAGAEHGVGVMTFARFYTLHTIVLPAIAVCLVGGHLFLVQRHGVTAKGAEDTATQTFYPKQLWRDTLAIFVAFAALFAAAELLDVPLERKADPTDVLYTPRPEWYFLFLFQTLKLVSGKLEWVGTIALPTLTVLGLLAVPFYSRRLRLDRKLPAFSAAILAASIWVGLTLAAVDDLPKRNVNVPRPFLEWSALPPEEIAGMNHFQALHCDSCHNITAGMPKAGPNLPRSPLEHPKQWLVQHVKTSQRDGAELSIVELNALLTFAINATRETADTIRQMSPEFIDGVKVYVASACNTCHKVNGMGGAIGPALNGLAYRRSKEWVNAHFLEPQKLSPGSIMPPYHFTEHDRDSLVLYLFSLEQ